MHFGYFDCEKTMSGGHACLPVWQFTASCDLRCPGHCFFTVIAKAADARPRFFTVELAMPMRGALDCEKTRLAGLAWALDCEQKCLLPLAVWAYGNSQHLPRPGAPDTVFSTIETAETVARRPPRTRLHSRHRLSEPLLLLPLNKLQGRDPGRSTEDIKGYPGARRSSLWAGD